MSDTPTGFDRAPDRYMASGRETVDKMRDEAYVVAHNLAECGLIAHDAIDNVGDILFGYACSTHALKYQDRAGLKGDAATDAMKAIWWDEMRLHSLTGAPDPRADRPDFVPYGRLE